MQSVKLIENISEKRDAWLELRRGYIGSSDIVTICGLSPYKSPLQLWAEWTGKVSSEQADERGFLEYGRIVEPLVRKRTAAAINAPLWAPDAMYRHALHEWAAATPDSFEGEPGQEPRGIWEHKTTTGRGSALWEAGPPPMPVTQLQWQFGVCGIERGGVSCIVGGDPEHLPLYRQEADAEMFEALLALGDHFRGCVQRDIPPEPGPNDSKLIEAICKRQIGREVDLSADIAALLPELRDKKAQKAEFEKANRELEARIKELQGRIMLALNGADTGRLPDGRVITQKQVKVAARVQNAYSYTRLILPD